MFKNTFEKIVEELWSGAESVWVEGGKENAFDAFERISEEHWRDADIIVKMERYAYHVYSSGLIIMFNYAGQNEIRRVRSA